MQSILLSRQAGTEQGTPGKLIIDGKEFCKTLELPWKDNLNGVSCIPTGRYICSVTYSQHFHRRLYLVKNVPGRSGVRIHSGNFAGSAPWKSHVLGCILLGSAFGKLNNQLAILGSRNTVKRFVDKMEGKDFELWIF